MASASRLVEVQELLLDTQASGYDDASYVPGTSHAALEGHPHAAMEYVALYTHFVNGSKCTHAECVRALKGLVLPRASHSGELALAGTRCLLPMLLAAPVLLAHAVVTVLQSCTLSPLHFLCIYLVYVCMPAPCAATCRCPSLCSRWAGYFNVQRPI
jgi:hypothetical protein